MSAICSSTLKMVALSAMSVQLTAEYRGLAGAGGPPGARQRRVAGFFFDTHASGCGKSISVLMDLPISGSCEVATARNREKIGADCAPADSGYPRIRRRIGPARIVRRDIRFNKPATAHEKQERYS